MELFILQPILFLVIPLYLYLYFYPSKAKLTPKGGFRIYPLLGTLPEFLINRHSYLQWTTEVLINHPTNTSVLYRPGNVRGVITANPLNVQHILKSKFDNYPKGDRFTYHLEDFLGRGIFNSDGHLWKIQRKTASYEFNTKSLRSFVMEIVATEIRTRLIPILEKAAETKGILDLQDILERFAFDNVCKVAFNVDPGCLSGDGTNNSDFMKAFEDAASLSSGRFRYVVPYFWKIKKFFNVGSERRLKNSIASVHAYAEKIIQSRKEAKYDNQGEDLLSRFIGYEENSTEFLRDIITSFILAGRDTTSAGLTWFFWVLSSNPDVVENIRNELKVIRERNGKKMGDSYCFEELREMHYLHGAISESLRLYPPVPVDTKLCLNDDLLPDGTFVRKNWFVTYHTYAMGRIDSIWGKDCEEFHPERWLENGVIRQENPFRFPVFHAGPRMCLGKDMAYMQMKSIAAAVIERFQVAVQNKEECPENVLSLTLRMKGGLLVGVKEDVAV